MAKRSGRRGRPGKARAGRRGARGASPSGTVLADGAASAGAAGDASSGSERVAGKRAAKPAGKTSGKTPGKPAGRTAGKRERGRAGPSSRAGRAAGRLGEQAALGERPQAPWHPLPLSELLIFVGLIGVVVGVARGESGLPVVAAGVGAICVGTLDFSFREHLSGYRPHTTLLATVPTALLHGGIAIAMVALGAPSPSFIVAPLLIDVPVFWVLYRLLRARFRDARRERMFAASR